MKNEWGREIDPEREVAIQRALHIIHLDARNDRQLDPLEALFRHMAIVPKDYKPVGIPAKEDL